jgi:hypothetical protein
LLFIHPIIHLSYGLGFLAGLGHFSGSFRDRGDAGTIKTNHDHQPVVAE